MMPEPDLEAPTEARRLRLWELLRQLEAEQNEYRRVYGGPVRQIHDGDLLVVEYALRCLLEPPERDAPASSSRSPMEVQGFRLRCWSTRSTRST